MSIGIPTLIATTFIKQTQSAIAYTLRRYQRTPANTVPLFSDTIISLPLQVAKLMRDPEALCKAIQSDLQSAFDRIFGSEQSERRVTIEVIYTMLSLRDYDVTMTVTYQLQNGETVRDSASISVDPEKGLIIPEDTIPYQ